MNYNTFTRVHVIKHVYTSTFYGFNQRLKSQEERPFIVCFQQRKDAKHVLGSLNTYNRIHGNHSNSLCVYDHHEVVEMDDLDYGLYVDEVYLDSLLDNIYLRNIGLYYITDISPENLQINSLQLYPYTYKPISLNLLENDFYLSY